VSVVQAFCPSCGAPITFKRGSSIVVICEYCRSAVARGDRTFEDLGKVAELMETGSPLQIGLHGSYQGIAFELTGRAQLGHQMGGMWDEWYAAFSDGRWGWLAEAQGRFYLTFQKQMPQQTLLPPFESVQPGQPALTLGSINLTVAEKGVATSLGAQGEIPYRLTPGEQHSYADLSGPHGEFATVDYSEARPVLFIGREVTLADLGLASAVAPKRHAQQVAAFQLNCPNCGGRLELRAPDQTQRVTCPNCGSLLDVNQGNLRFLEALRPAPVTPVIPIGSVGNFAPGKMTVIGFLQRSVTFDGVIYYWEEYLLYEPQLGFRWLVRSDDHWNFVQTLAPGMVTEEGDKARFADQDYKIYQDAAARVEYVSGEFYWKVSVGETVRAVDYIRPPYILSQEATSNEINWSLGTYLKPADVEQAFGISGLPKPSGVAPNQPFPHGYIYKLWGKMFLAAFLVGLVMMFFGSGSEVFKKSFELEPRKSADDTQVIFTEPFELRGNKNIRVAATADVSNTWVYLEGDLINEETGVVQPFSMPVEYYSGVEDGESWSEGDRSPELHLSALPAGKYTMRLEVQWERWQQPQTLEINVVQGVPRLLYWVLTLVAISVIPLLTALYHYSFEKRRWADSNFSPYDSGGDDDD